MVSVAIKSTLNSWRGDDVVERDYRDAYCS